MLPDDIVTFLQSPVFFGLATRDANLRPRHAMPVGAVADADAGRVTFFLPTAVAGEVLEDLADNGQVALGCADPLTHRAYQLKGIWESDRAATAADDAVIRIWRDKLVARATQSGFPEPMVKALVLGLAFEPATGITFRPRQIYLQTPGPDAGKLIHNFEADG